MHSKTKLSFIFIIFSLVFNTYAKEIKKDQLDTIIAKVLGPNIMWLTTDKHNKKNIIKKLGKADRSERDLLSYVINDYKYALNITLSNDIIIKFSYKLTDKKKLPLKQLRKYISSKDLFPYPKDSHLKGKYIAYKHKGYILLFSNNSKQNLVRVYHDN